MTTFLRKYSRKFSILKDSILNVYDLSGESKIREAKKIIKKCDSEIIDEDWNRVGDYISSSTKEYIKNNKI